MSIINELRGIIRSNKNPTIASMVIVAVDKLKSRDLDIFIYKIQDQEWLIHNKKNWLPML